MEVDIVGHDASESTWSGRRGFELRGGHVPWTQDTSDYHRVTIILQPETWPRGARGTPDGEVGSHGGTHLYTAAELEGD